ncbi:MAG: long-chain-fatty-acid--CoA ligase [Geminicoccaceae bacterium]
MVLRSRFLELERIDQGIGPGPDRDSSLAPRPLYALLDDAVARFPAAPCLDFLGFRYRYRDVARLVARAARGLQAIGVYPGTRVGLMLPNTPYFVVLYFAVLKAGGVVVCFNPLLAEREIEQQIADSGVEIMATLDLGALFGKLTRVLARRPVRHLVVCRMSCILPMPKRQLFRMLRRREVANIPTDERHIWFERLIVNDGRVDAPACEPERTVAMLQYTGGTTGTPKGAELTHASLYSNAMQVGRWFHTRKPGQERILGVLPLFHIFGMATVMNAGLQLGAELILLPKFEIEQLMLTIHKKRPTIFPAVPTLFAAITRYDSRSRYDLSSIEICVSGGAPLPAEVKDSFERLTGCIIVEGYGLTEASPVVCINPVDGVRKTGSIGLPLPLTSVDIVSLEDGRTPVPRGERGELCVRGPQVMRGYLGRPAETAQALAGGHLHTGDVAYQDEDGYVFIVDRIKDVILTGGFNVYPRNVEEAIYLHPAVEECVVAGVPDAYRGQAVKAWIKLGPGRQLSRDELRAFLEDKISHIEMPWLVEFRGRPLPKTMIGKLSRKDLLAEEAVAAGTGAAA